ncbi:MAG: BACON domain-containing protein, partial [Bacteroidales bacterium]|nr:BACON domain-containing protein [Bacteroidales bacterium]
ASSTVVMTLPAEQTAVPESYDPAAFLLVATPATSAAIPNPLNVTFRRAVALNELTLTNVPESISSVTITAEGCTLAGGREINLATGASTSTFSDESESVTVRYAEAQPAGTLKVYFTSWGASLASGSVLKIRVDCPSGTWYRGGIAAGESGITLVENDLNKLSVNMSGAVARPTAAEAFAEAFAGELAVWDATTGAIVDLAGENPAVGAEYGYGQYIPHNITVTANGVNYTKAQAFYVAGKLLQSLMGGGTMFNTALAEAPASCNWPQNSFNEGPGNGGPCTLTSAKIDLLTTASKGHLDRAFTYLGNHSGVFANFYGGSGNPTGYTTVGPTCMERVNLLLVRVFDYIVSNGITAGFAAALQDVDFDADLYRVPVRLSTVAPPAIAAAGGSTDLTVTATEAWTAVADASWLSISPASGNAGTTTVTLTAIANGASARSAVVDFRAGSQTIVSATVSQNASATVTMLDFATAFAGILDVWESHTASGLSVGQEVVTGHYVPSNTTITVGGTTYTKAQMYDIANQGLLAFAAGGSLTAAVPSPRAYSWSSNPYSEPAALGVSGGVCTWNFIQNVSTRQNTYAGNNSRFANYCAYTSGQVSGYTGYCCLERSFLIAARFYKYLVDNNITTNIISTVGNHAFDIELFNYTEPETNYPSPWVQEGIHLEQKPGYLAQINGYNCGPHSLMQCIYKITGIDMKESTLASWAGTTENGTGTDGLATALARFNSNYGYSLTMTLYNYSAVTRWQIGQWMANPKTAIFFHLYYRNQWGHYELPYEITENGTTLQVANSLGDYYNGVDSSDGYFGYIETRTWADQESYIRNMSQKSVIVIRNPN